MKKITPKKIFRAVRNVSFGYLPGGALKCNLCQHNIWKFTPYRYGFKLASMEALELINGSPSSFSCPRCGCHDRERHLALFIEASEISKKFKNSKILHFAPERNLVNWLRKKSPLEHVLCDLNPMSEDVKNINIEKINYPDNYFDFVIANHVLEHVENDLKALSEIERVLSIGGYAILQTPFSGVLKSTWHDPGISSDISRLHAYGQEDHVRLYGCDIFDRFSSRGLVSCKKSHQELLGDIDCSVYGISSKEPFFLFRKNG